MASILWILNSVKVYFRPFTCLCMPSVPFQLKKFYHVNFSTNDFQGFHFAMHATILRSLVKWQLVVLITVVAKNFGIRIHIHRCGKHSVVSSPAISAWPALHWCNTIMTCSKRLKCLLSCILVTIKRRRMIPFSFISMAHLFCSSAVQNALMSLCILCTCSPSVSVCWLLISDFFMITCCGMHKALFLFR